MGERAKQASWWAEGIKGRCLGSAKKPAGIGSVSPVRVSRRLLSEFVSNLTSSSFLSQGSLRRSQSSRGCQSSSDTN